MKELFEMHAIVKGLVQGVGFRATTRYHAKQLGLKGTVRNLADGSVEIHAQGEKPRLEALMEALRKEEGLGRIEEAAIEYIPIQQCDKDFLIIH